MSIIIPFYNMADLAVRAVESVLVQTYPNIAIIAVDEGIAQNRITPEDLKVKMGLI